MTSKTLSPLVGDSAQHGDDAEESSVAQPADQSDFYNLAFYNIGSDIMENVVDDPAAKICDMIYEKCIDSIEFHFWWERQCFQQAPFARNMSPRKPYTQNTHRI